MYKVFILDDVIDNCIVISELLSPQFKCEYSHLPQEALAKIREFKPNLILLDFKMPILNGVDICRALKEKEETKNIPIIFISGAATEDEKIESLESGGDDFIAKPFHPKELILRVQKRIIGYVDSIKSTAPSAPVQAHVISALNLEMNLNSRLVYVDKKEVILTPKQFEILKLLIENKNNLVSRQTFMLEVWGHNEVTPRNVDSQINYLKKKIDGFTGLITAVPSFGYRLDCKD